MPNATLCQVGTTPVANAAMLWTLLGDFVRAVPPPQGGKTSARPRGCDPMDRRAMDHSSTAPLLSRCPFMHHNLLQPTWLGLLTLQRRTLHRRTMTAGGSVVSSRCGGAALVCRYEFPTIYEKREPRTREGHFWAPSQTNLLGAGRATPEGGRVGGAERREHAPRRSGRRTPERGSGAQPVG